MRLGFIGAGRMAEAIISGLIRTCAAKPENIAATDISAPRLEELAARHGVETLLGDRDGLLEKSDVVFIAVKPQQAAQALSGAGERFGPSRLAVSIMGGVTTQALEKLLPGVPVVRVMPNIPMSVGEGAAGICAGALATEEHLELVRGLMGSLGRAFVLPEALIDPLTGVSGCGPAFAYMFIEALADGGVAAGLSRELALELAAQTLVGAGRLMLESGRHPGALKDEVCSPGGSTIAGVAALETSGFRGAVIKAVEASVGRMKG